MKVQKVVLKELEVKNIDGEFKTQYVNEQTYPAFLTNYAMKKGKEMGLIESSILHDLLKLQALQGAKDGEEVNLSALEQIDQTNMHKFIYLAFQGANPKEKMSFDDFLEKFHEPLVESMQLYATLISDVISQDPNQFAAAFQKSTNTGGKDKKN